MNDPRYEPTDSRRRWLLGIGVAALTIAVVWLLWPTSGKVAEPARVRREAPASESNALHARIEPKAMANAPERASPKVVMPAEPIDDTREEQDEDDPHFNENATPEGHPHPITPAHERIFRENNLIASLNNAMDAGDFSTLRRINAKYRRDYPEDENVMQEGYDLIADCQERRTAETEARAKEFFDKRRASMLRRYVRRYCFSAP